MKCLLFGHGMAVAAAVLEIIIFYAQQWECRVNTSRSRSSLPIKLSERVFTTHFWLANEKASFFSWAFSIYKRRIKYKFIFMAVSY